MRIERYKARKYTYYRAGDGVGPWFHLGTAEKIVEAVLAFRSQKKETGFENITKDLENTKKLREEPPPITQEEGDADLWGRPTEEK